MLRALSIIIIACLALMMLYRVTTAFRRERWERKLEQQREAIEMETEKKRSLREQALARNPNDTMKELGRMTKLYFKQRWAALKKWLRVSEEGDERLS